MKILPITFSLLSIFATSCSDKSNPEPAKKDTQELTKAAMAGDAEAMAELEKQVVQVAAKMKAKVEKLAAGGDEKAQVDAAWLNGGEEKVRMLAEAGNVQALFELGKHYNALVEGKQVLGRDWLLKAAKSGHARAMFLVGKHSMHGLTGFEKDVEFGRAYLEKSAKAGDAEAAFTLGVALRYGHGLEVDKQAALALYKLAESGGSRDVADELKSLQQELADK